MPIPGEREFLLTGSIFETKSFELTDYLMLQERVVFREAGYS
jgi:hypothetical protein